jgi:hypothetical protein
MWSCFGLSPSLPPSLLPSSVSSYMSRSSPSLPHTHTHFLTNSTRARRRVSCVRRSRYVQPARERTGEREGGREGDRSVKRS